MKLLIVLTVLSLCSIAIGETLEEHAKKVLDEIMEYVPDCAEKHQATPEDIDKLMKKEMPGSKGGQCIIQCVNKRFGLQLADGKINKGGQFENLERVKDIDEGMYNKMSSVWKKCSESVPNADDECDTGIALFKCLNEEGNKAGVGKEALGF